jgi:hypothetical protein
MFPRIYEKSMDFMKKRGGENFDEKIHEKSVQTRNICGWSSFNILLARFRAINTALPKKKKRITKIVCNLAFLPFFDVRVYGV